MEAKDGSAPVQQESRGSRARRGISTVFGAVRKGVRGVVFAAGVVTVIGTASVIRAIRKKRGLDGIPPAPGRGVLEFDLRSVTLCDVEGVQLSPTSTSEIFRERSKPSVPLRHAIRAIERAKADPRISSLIIRCEEESQLSSLGLAGVLELRNAVHTFSQSKPSLAYSSGFGSEGSSGSRDSCLAYLLASACHDIATQPGSVFCVPGFAASGAFIKRALGLIGISPVVRARGEYKGAGDSLIREEFSPEQREAVQALLQTEISEFCRAVVDFRKQHFTQEEFKVLLDSMPMISDHAKDSGLIDLCLYRDQIPQAIRLRVLQHRYELLKERKEALNNLIRTTETLHKAAEKADQMYDVLYDAVLLSIQATLRLFNACPNTLAFRSGKPTLLHLPRENEVAKVKQEIGDETALEKERTAVVVRNVKEEEQMMKIYGMNVRILEWLIENLQGKYRDVLRDEDYIGIIRAGDSTATMSAMLQKVVIVKSEVESSEKKDKSVQFDSSNKLWNLTADAMPSAQQKLIFEQRAASVVLLANQLSNSDSVKQLQDQFDAEESLLKAALKEVEQKQESFSVSKQHETAAARAVPLQYFKFTDYFREMRSQDAREELVYSFLSNNNNGKSRPDELSPKEQAIAKRNIQRADTLLLKIQQRAPMFSPEAALPPALPSERKSIALIYISGAITESSAAPVRAALRSAHLDSSIDAVVLRINSPGGSATVSESLWRTSQNLVAEKPLIVSFGNVAASGGFYSAMSANRIFAHSATITGSIGVILARANFGQLSKKLGIDVDVIHPEGGGGKYAHLFGGGPAALTESWNEVIEKRLDVIMDGMYGLFKKRVMEGRKMDGPAVENLARGRVWSGLDAYRNGLIDELGGLNESLDYAKQMIGVEKDDAVNIRVFPKPSNALWKVLGLSKETRDDDFEVNDVKEGMTRTLVKEFGGLLIVNLLMKLNMELMVYEWMLRDDRFGIVLRSILNPKFDVNQVLDAAWNRMIHMTQPVEVSAGDLTVIHYDNFDEQDAVPGQRDT
eukprot:CAMPEP_0182452428 /NCGR_PEP_ID=MMETSP1172-20130603/44245_1 /TAXON_ID=708627 /ORGANISM="Timspurckia oligopyrenoides, Strain CCMP3278" /LENGTH=1023 /DNA_ID=CAMNT_0024650261 /DNA_START=46 /DNA_END=3117 /DNA_ORIENTATION=-